MPHTVFHSKNIQRINKCNGERGMGGGGRCEFIRWEVDVDRFRVAKESGEVPLFRVVHVILYWFPFPTKI